MDWGLIVFGVLFVLVMILGIPEIVKMSRNRPRGDDIDPREELGWTLSERCLTAEDLIELVRPYAEHERWLFNQLETAAERLEDAVISGSDQQIITADRAFEGALHDVLALAEVYPDLEASPEFVELLEDLDDSTHERALRIRNYAKTDGGVPADRWA